MEKNTRFSIRKLGVGVASVAVASFFASGTASAHNLEALTSSKANPEMPFAHVPVKIEFTQAESPWMPTTTPESDNNSIEYTGAERPFAGRELPTAPVKANFDNPEAPFAPAKAEVEFTPAERPFAGRELPTPPLEANYNDPKAPFAPADQEQGQDQDESKSIPWTDLTPAERIEGNLGLDQEQENPKDPEKESIPWTELTPAEEITDNSDSDETQDSSTNDEDSIPWTELTPATPIEEKSTPLIPLEPAKKVTPLVELTPATPSVDEYETLMTTLINDLRLSYNLHEISYNPIIQSGVDLRSEEIVETFAHQRPNGEKWQTAFIDEQLGTYGGENIVSISKNSFDGDISDPKIKEQVVKTFFIMWKGSAKHLANMLNPNVTAVTFSIFDDGTSYYGVQIFSTPAP